MFWLQVDAMKIGVKEFKKEYKNINIDNIEVRFDIAQKRRYPPANHHEGVISTGS